jgi:hypothetical protein
MPITKTKKKAVKKVALPTGWLGRFTTTDGKEQYKVKRTNTEFIFGCGDQSFTHEEVRNFLTELKKRQGKKRSQQELDYETVLEAVDGEGWSIDDLDSAELTKFFFTKNVKDDDDC